MQTSVKVTLSILGIAAVVSLVAALAVMYGKKKPKQMNLYAVNRVPNFTEFLNVLRKAEPIKQLPYEIEDGKITLLPTSIKLPSYYDFVFTKLPINPATLKKMITEENGWKIRDKESWFVVPVKSDKGNVDGEAMYIILSHAPEVYKDGVTLLFRKTSEQIENMKNIKEFVISNPITIV